MLESVTLVKHTYVDATDKANLLADYFSSVFTSEDVTNIPTLGTETTSIISPIRIHKNGYYPTFNSIWNRIQTGITN